MKYKTGDCYIHFASEARSRIHLKLILALLTFAVFFSAFGSDGTPSTSRPTGSQQVCLPEEKHLKNIKQLSFGGENAEAYFSADGKQLIFQSKRDGRACDQIYAMNIDGSNVHMVSNGDGRTT